MRFYARVTAVGAVEWEIGVDGDGNGAKAERVAEGSGRFEVGVDSGTVGTGGAGSSTAGVISG